MLRISVLVSGGGTNLQAVIDSIEKGKIKDAQIVLIISSSEQAYALERGRKYGIPTAVIDAKRYPHAEKRTEAIIGELKAANTDMVVLAGYMSILRPEFIQAFKGRIINIHPSLIPKFCGAGFYGKRVHEAVLEAKETESGATVHYVDEGVDTGPIIIQRKVAVLRGDSADSLAARVLTVEHEILTEAINMVKEKMKAE